jgi:hypothetical protein
MILGATLIAGLSLSQWPLETVGVFILIAGIAALTGAPKPVAAAFLGFLVIQDPLILLAGGDETAVGLIVKRADEVLLLVYAASAILFTRRIHALIRDRQLVLAIGGCFAGMLLSSYVQGVELLPAVVDLVLFSKPFLLLTIGVSLAPTDETTRRLRNPVLVTMLCIVLFAIVFMLFPQLQDSYIGQFRAPDERVGIVSAQGFFDGPGPYSWFCAVTFALAYAAYLSFGRKPYLVAAAISALFVLLSWRRKSIAGLAIMLFVAVMVGGDGSRRRLRAVVATGLLVLSGAIVLAPYFGHVVSYTVREYGGFDPLSNARLALHYTSLLIARDHFPLGTGLASFGSYASRLYYSPTYVAYGISNIWGLSPQFSGFITDTFWPMVLGEGGVFTLVCYVMFLSFIGRTAWNAARSPQTTVERRFLAIFVLFVLVGSLLESTSSHIYDATMQSALVMIPAGALWSLEHYSNTG